MTRRARSLDAGPAKKVPAWREIVFTDLHVSAKTLDRALLLLAKVRDLALLERFADCRPGVVCLGDFWDQRGVLNVRQVHALMDEFDRWQAADIRAVFIPGNHDQVSQSGRVHGVRIFSAYPNIIVATDVWSWRSDPTARTGNRVFLPWREDTLAQEQMVKSLEGDGWTIFAHADVRGAVGNNGHKSSGRVSIKAIEEKARACYLGHFHKRQKLGDRTWYVGSPFEMNFGERDEPHGVAVVDSLRPEPEFIDFEDFPRHHRLTLGEPLPPTIRKEDFVEVECASDDVGSPALAKFVSKIPSKDVRPRPVHPPTTREAPAFAPNLREALRAYVDQEWKLPMPERLLQLGEEYIASVPDGRGIVALSPQVEILSVAVTDFCAVRGTFDFAFPRGVALLRGPVAVGKTSIADAVTWCLFGQTTPRKAGQHGASLKADDVVNDSADTCSVSVTVGIPEMLAPEKLHEIVVTRSKKRGQGARIDVTNVTIPSGISDQQDVVHHVLGVDYDLWRSCVYLGQGAVGNFVTDADKRRKDLLARAFGVSACADAQKIVREDLKVRRVKLDSLRTDGISDERVLSVLRETDYTGQLQGWEAQRKARMEAIHVLGEEEKAKVASCDAKLADEKTWVDLRQQHEDHLSKLAAQFAKLEPAARLADLQRQVGAAQAEKSLVERDLAKNRAELTRVVSDPSARSCPTCGKPLDANAAEQHVSDLEKAVENLSRSVKTFDVRIANLSVEIQNTASAGSSEREAVAAGMEESREALRKCAEALNLMTRIKANREDAQLRLEGARKDYAREEKGLNPFRQAQLELEGKVRTLEAKLGTDKEALAEGEREEKTLQFWEEGFGQNGVPVLVLRQALWDLESHANKFLSEILRGRVFCRLAMDGDDLQILFFEYEGGVARERRYEQLSGGQRRCVELAFHPFALSELIFARCGVRVGLMVIDEITSHLGAEEKPLVVDVLKKLGRSSVVVIDHDPTIQGEFDVVFDLSRDVTGALQAVRA